MNRWDEIGRVFFMLLEWMIHRFHSSKAEESEWKLPKKYSLYIPNIIIPFISWFAYIIPYTKIPLTIQIQKTSWNVLRQASTLGMQPMMCFDNMLRGKFQLFTKQDSCFAYYLDFDMHGGVTDILSWNATYHTDPTWIFGNHRLSQPDEMKGIAGIATIYYLDVPWS